jgi:hypothetical protein
MKKKKNLNEYKHEFYKKSDDFYRFYVSAPWEKKFSRGKFLDSDRKKNFPEKISDCVNTLLDRIIFSLIKFFFLKSSENPRFLLKRRFSKKIPVFFRSFSFYRS